MKVDEIISQITDNKLAETSIMMMMFAVGTTVAFALNRAAYPQVEALAVSFLAL